MDEGPQSPESRQPPPTRSPGPDHQKRDSVTFLAKELCRWDEGSGEVEHLLGYPGGPDVPTRVLMGKE